MYCTSTEDGLEYYSHITVKNANDVEITPSKLMENGDGEGGEFKTVYKAISFGDADVLNAAKGQYVIGFKVPNTTKVPSFKIIAENSV